MTQRQIIPVILSGGSGTRLWPMSRPERPKQLLALTAEETMLQLTARRVAGEAFAAPIVVGNARHADLVEEQLRHAGVSPAALILEPAGRNTAPAIALAASAEVSGFHRLKRYAVVSLLFVPVTILLAGSAWQFAAVALGIVLVSIVPGHLMLAAERAHRDV